MLLRENRSSGLARVAAVIVAMIVGGVACVTVTYPGPRLPAERVAVIEARGVAIEAIDGAYVQRRANTLEVLPGNHVLILRHAERTVIPSPMIWVTISRWSDAVSLCVSASPKHFYSIENRLARGSLWNPIIVDGDSGIQIPPCGPIGDQRRGDFPCGDALVEESLASGLQRVSGCGVENVYGYDLAAGQWRSVTEQVMFELNCPGTQLAVHYLGANKVAVDGCGIHAEYLAGMQCAADGRCVFGVWLPSRGGR